jgi:hypothetical protein
MREGVRVMEPCEIPREDRLPNPVHLKLEGPGLDFERATKAAKNLAKSYSSDAMLVSWFDRKAGRYSPHEVHCCKEGEPPSWVEYARSRGGNLTIDINHEEYVFVFRGKQGLS